VASLRILLDTKLTSERDKALATLDEQETRLEGSPDFASLEASAREQVLALSLPAREVIALAHFVTGIRDRAQRYLTEDYPSQLALVSRLAAAAAAPVGTDDTPPPPPPPIHYTPSSQLEVKCGLPYISSVAELEEWLAALRIAAKAELDRGHRISL
jgi:hypothetical protein